MNVFIGEAKGMAFPVVVTHFVVGAAVDNHDAVTRLWTQVMNIHCASLCIDPNLTHRVPLPSYAPLLSHRTTRLSHCTVAALLLYHFVPLTLSVKVVPLVVRVTWQQLSPAQLYFRTLSW